MQKAASVGIMVCSDGWKRKAALQGKPLVNVMVLKPDGGAIFIKVLSFDGKFHAQNDLLTTPVLCNVCALACTLQRLTLFSEMFFC